jgi:hypothetical protein
LSRTDKKIFPCFPHPVSVEVNTRFPLINDFRPTNDITKFVDDSSIFEVVLQNARSKLDQTLSKTSEWVERNYMELHGEKTKELRITFSDHNFDLGNQLLINNEPHVRVVRLVSKAKFLGFTLSDDLKWNDHIQDICSKASINTYIF